MNFSHSFLMAAPKKLFFVALIFALEHFNIASAEGVSLKQPRSSQGAQRGAFSSESRCAADTTQRILMDCMMKENDRYDQEVENELNNALTAAESADLDKAGIDKVKKTLLATQAAWETYRKLDCESILHLLDDSDSGSLEFLNCMRRHSKQRLQDFEDFSNQH